MNNNVIFENCKLKNDKRDVLNVLWYLDVSLSDILNAQILNAKLLLQEMEQRAVSRVRLLELLQLISNKK